MLFETVAYRLIVLRAESMKPNLTIFYQLLPAAAQFIFHLSHHLLIYFLIQRYYLPHQSVFGITFLSLGVLGGAVSTFTAMLFETVAYRLIVLRATRLEEYAELMATRYAEMDRNIRISA